MIKKIRYGDIFESPTGKKLMVVLNDSLIHFHDGSSYPITVVDTAQFRYLGNQLDGSVGECQKVL